MSLIIGNHHEVARLRAEYEESLRRQEDLNKALILAVNDLLKTTSAACLSIELMVNAVGLEDQAAAMDRLRNFVEQFLTNKTDLYRNYALDLVGAAYPDAKGDGI